MINKIAIIGPQGVGKTTLSKALVQTDELWDYAVMPSPVREFTRQYGINIERADIFDELVLINYQLEVSMLPFKTISDRSALDHYAYAQWYRDHGLSNISTMQWEYFSTQTMNIMKRFNPILLLEPEFPLVPDGFRIVDENQQREVTNILKLALNEFGLKFYRIQGSVEERVSQTLAILKEMES